jgi:general secretion pathway protein D
MLGIFLRVRTCAALTMLVVVAGCGNTLEGSRLLEDKLASAPAGATKQARLQEYLGADAHKPILRPLYSQGTDELTAASTAQLVAADDRSTDFGDLKLNLLDVPVAVAAKAVLSDVLGLNYSIDSRVQGTMTIQTSQPVSERQLVMLFEGALRDVGAGLVASGKSYRIVPLAEAPKGSLRIDTASEDGAGLGQRSRLVILKYVSASEITEVIEPLLPPGMILKTDRTRNALILNGTDAEVAAIRETVAVFDVDWMKGMSIALVPVKSAEPTAIVSDLNQIYDTKKGPLRGMLRFVPNKRLKSVLVISSRSKYLREASSWIKKLDVLAEGNEQGLHVYGVQNRTASELSKVLQSVLRSEQGAASTAASNSQLVAPKYETQVVGAESAAQPISGPETPEAGLGSNESPPGQSDADLAQPEMGSPVPGSAVRVVADDANNSLLIFATTAEYERILRVLEEVDSQPNQVLLEAVIAEVSLDDELKFGVRWLIGESQNHGTFSDLATGAVASTFPGFSYFLKANDISFTLNALSSVTDVRVISSPSLIVLDNKSATLQVGDQVPVVTQQARGTTATDAPIVNSVEMKDTGVILRVTPRVNDSGRVILDIEQEVSNVVKTTTSGIDSPTIRQRKITTSVVLTDGDAMALGGLIQERETAGQSKVPVLGDVPLIKNAFRHKTNAVARTELIIFIRPRVIRDMQEARRITKEFREELDIQAPRVRRSEATPGGELVRIIQ